MSKFCLQKQGITRREFLNRGMNFAGGIVLAPTLYGLIGGTSEALAEGDAIILGLTVGLRGGNHFHAQVKSVQTNGQDYASYSQQRPLSSGVTEFGGLKIWNDSPLHSQLVAPIMAAGGNLASNIRMGLMHGRTPDDGGGFQVATRQYAQVAAARARTLLPGISNGIGGASFLDDANALLSPFTPVPISGLANYQGLFSWDSGILKTTQISSQGMQEAMRLASGQSTRKVLSLLSQAVRGADNLRDAAQKAYPEVVSRFASATPPNPVTDTTNFGSWTGAAALVANPTTDVQRQALILACIVQAAVNGQIAAAHWNLQGYDLHGQGQTYANRDLEMWAQIRAALGTLSAAGQRMGKRVIVQMYFTSDGAHAMAANNGAANDNARGNHPTGDTGEIASHIMICYDSGQAPAFSRNYIGQYNSSQRVDLTVADPTAQVIANSAPNQAAATTANFAKLLGLNPRDFAPENVIGSTFIQPG